MCFSLKALLKCEVRMLLYYYNQRSFCSFCLKLVLNNILQLILLRLIVCFYLNNSGSGISEHRSYIYASSQTGSIVNVDHDSYDRGLANESLITGKWQVVTLTSKHNLTSSQETPYWTGIQ